MKLIKKTAILLLLFFVTVNLSADKAKYVFLFIGDGMGKAQLNAAEAYLRTVDESGSDSKKLIINQFPSQGLATTKSADSLITDSAAAATAIATGRKTNSGVISMNKSKRAKLKTIAEIAKKEGKKVGIISSVYLDHATPASFYAHTPSRNNYYKINMQLAKSNFDYFAGGMVRIDKTPDGKKNAHQIMREKGWSIATTRAELNSLKKGRQIYAYNRASEDNAFDYTIDQDEKDITLAEFTKKGIELLDNDNGFFIMVEGGKIDWACHANDAAASVKDTIAFDEAVKEAVEFYKLHPNETLIVVTGDHETGGLTVGFDGLKDPSAFGKIDNQKISHEVFTYYTLYMFKENYGRNAKLKDLLPIIEESFGLSDFTDSEMKKIEKAFELSMMDEDKRNNDGLYGGYEPITVTLTHILNQRAGFTWASYSHTGVPVPTFAMGINQEAFNGYYPNTDIFKKIHTTMGF